MGVPSGDDFIEVNTSKAEFITFDFVKHGMHLFAVTFKLQNVCNMVRHSSPSSCSARKKPRTSSSTLPAGCGREIVCGSELLCSSVWRIVFRSSRNCSRCACWHSARQSQFVRCPAGIADRSSHACRWSGLSRNSVVPKRAVCGLSCMACYHRPLPRPYGPSLHGIRGHCSRSSPPKQPVSDMSISGWPDGFTSPHRISAAARPPSMPAR